MHSLLARLGLRHHSYRPPIDGEAVLHPDLITCMPARNRMMANGKEPQWHLVDDFSARHQEAHPHKYLSRARAHSVPCPNM